MQILYYGGDIITMKDKNDNPEAILIEDDKIKFVGKLKEAELLCKSDVKFNNLQGKTLMPAFIDPHSHISMMAQFSTFSDLSQCSCFDDIISTLKYYKENKNISNNEVLLGFGYDHNFLKENRHPDKFILDKVSKDIPIYIFHTSGHMGVANSKLLEIAGIDENTKDPKGGKFGRIINSKAPNGYIEESSAVNKVLEKIFPKIKFDAKKQIKDAENIYLKNGITTVQDGAATRENIEIFVSLAEKDLLKVDIVSYPLIQNDTKKFIEEYLEYDRKYKNHFKIGGWKLILDGSPQGKSAWLTKPYEDEEIYCGYPNMSSKDVEAYCFECIENNFQLLAHCNGDAASDQFINCYKSAFEKSNNVNKYNLRPVMIHCQTVRNDQLDEMAKLKMIPSIFVAHTYYWGDIHLKNLGKERGNHISPSKSALERGLKINFHQDAPVVPPKVLHSVWCAVNRITKESKKIGDDESIDVFNALKAVTINCAYEYFEEDIKGTLEVNKLADMIILDKNPLKIDKMEIKDIKVLETIKEGEVVYKQ